MQEMTVTEGHLSALSCSAMAFARVTATDDVYRQIAVQVQKLLGNAIVVVSSFDAVTELMVQRAMVGLSQRLADIAARSQVQLSPLDVPASRKAVDQMKSGRLVKLELGLYELFFGKVPLIVTRSLERAAGAHGVYGMGCVAEGECFGGITFCLRKSATLPPTAVLEALIYQAAVAIKRWQAEGALRQSEERYRLLMEHAADPYVVADMDARFVDVNNAACVALGYSRQEMLRLTALEILDPQELSVQPFPWEQIRNRETFVQTRRVRCKDGHYTTFEVRAAPLPGEHVLFCARDITQRREMERAAIEAGEQERRAVGRDLHDSLGQQLAATGYLASALARSLDREQHPRNKEARRIAELARDSVSQTRRMAHGLCPIDMSEEGLANSLTQLAAQLRSAGLVTCDLTIDGLPDTLTAEATMHLYQVAQEAAGNAIRHGHATHVALAIRRRGDRGELTIRDDGSGMPPKAEEGTGLGLRAMRYRAELLDGTLHVQSGTAGTSVTCTFPLPPAHSGAGADPCSAQEIDKAQDKACDKG